MEFIVNLSPSFVRVKGRPHKNDNFNNLIYIFRKNCSCPSGWSTPKLNDSGKHHFQSDLKNDRDTDSQSKLNLPEIY